jgi:hypothetical protein
VAEKDGTRFWSENNLQAQRGNCHGAKTRVEQGEKLAPVERQRHPVVKGCNPSH